jgi:hypothetical protein
MAKLPWYCKNVKTSVVPKKLINGEGFKPSNPERLQVTFEISRAGQLVLGAKALWTLLLTIITKKSHGHWEIVK